MNIPVFNTPVSYKAIVNIVILIALYAAAMPARAQQLRELHIAPATGTPIVDPNYPDGVYLIFQSPIQNLEFESNWVIFNNQSFPENGQYRLVVDTVRQALRISSPGLFLTKEITVPKLGPKQSRYYSVEPADQYQVSELLKRYNAGRYLDTIEQLNSFLLSGNISTLQQNNASYLIVMCLVQLGRIGDGERALRELLENTPEYTPFTPGAPPVVGRLFEAIQDSLHALKPGVPQGFEARYANNRIILSWRPNTTEKDIAGYHIYRGFNQNQMGRIASIHAGGLSYTDEVGDSLATYYYFITAYDDYNPPQESDYSDLKEVQVTPPISKLMELDLAPDAAIVNAVLYQISDSLLGVSYDLIGEFHRTYDIALSVSNNGGEDYTIIPKTLSGDHGANVQDGLEKRISWNMLADFPAGLTGGQFKLHIDAEPQPLADQVAVIAEPDSLIQVSAAIARNDSMIALTYALTKDTKKRYEVIPMVSDDRGQYAIVQASFEGDWGNNQAAGDNKLLEWNVLQFFPQGLTGSIQLKLTVSEEPPQKKHTWKYVAGGSVLAAGVLAIILNPRPSSVASAPPGRPGN